MVMLPAATGDVAGEGRRRRWFVSRGAEERIMDKAAAADLAGNGCRSCWQRCCWCWLVSAFDSWWLRAIAAGEKGTAWSCWWKREMGIGSSLVAGDG